MNNAILFFYNINIQEIKKINNNYYFNYLNNSYGIYLYSRALEELQELYDLNNMLLNLGLIGYEIFLTKEGNIIFPYGNSLYILMRMPNIKNRIITYEDVISFNFNVEAKNYRLLDKSNWSYNWSQKIDYISYQFSQMSNKYKIINDSIDYFTWHPRQSPEDVLALDYPPYVIFRDGHRLVVVVGPGKGTSLQPL